MTSDNASGKTPRIAIDAMGGDKGIAVTVPGALAAARHSPLHLLFVGDEVALGSALEKHDTRGLSFEIVHASRVADMQDKPSDVLRRMKDSSIQVTCRLVRDGHADAMVSAGNSGATVACGMFIIGRIKSVARPAFAGIMPTAKRPVVLLDVGANVDSKPLHLFQFGILGSTLAQDMLEYARPRVGLLSIGEEEGKGNSQVKESFDMLRESSLEFMGNVEGRDIFTGDVDVVVCDGFVGNIALKLAEGLAVSMGTLLKQELTSTLSGRIGTLLAKKNLTRFARTVDYAEYGGAPLLGLNGVVIVCHGASSHKAITNATRMAQRFINNDINEHMRTALAAHTEIQDQAP